MRNLTAKLLAGSGVTEASHPGLVSLLELAAAGPGIPKGSAQDTPALRKRLLRDWGRVCEAFRACVSAGVVDADLLRFYKAAAFCDLGLGPAMDGPPGWEYVGESAPMGARASVAMALVRVAESKPHKLRAFDILSLSDLRKAQKANRLPSLTMPLLGVSGHVESALLPGRLVVVSWMIWGLRLCVVLQADQFGRLKAIAYRETVKQVLDAAGGPGIP